MRGICAEVYRLSIASYMLSKYSWSNFSLLSTMLGAANRKLNKTEPLS